MLRYAIQILAGAMHRHGLIGKAASASMACAAMLTPVLSYANAMPDPPAEQMPDIEEMNTAVKVKERNFVIVPIPLSNPTLGTGLVLGGAYFYRQTPEQRKAQPPSVTGAAGMYTSNDSYAYGIGQQNFWGGDKWRFSGFLGHVDVKLDLSPPSAAVDIDWQVSGDFLQAKLLRRIAGDWYLGIQGRAFDNLQTFSAQIDGEGFDLGVELKTVGLGALLNYDTRDSQLNPGSGRRFELAALFNEELVGSSDTYQGYDASFGSYHGVATDLVLAWEARGCYKSGNVPLWDACKVRLRGFPIQQYLGKSSASAQIEARWKPFKTFGFVGFVGGGSADRSYAEKLDDDLIPSYGVGVRWMILKSQRINLRIDYARSDDQDAWYLAVGEAF